MYKGIAYTSSTVRTDTTKSVQGCDSVYTVATIAVNKITPTIINVSISGCSSVFYKGLTYTSSTVRTDTTKSLQGCDSIYTIATITVTKITPTIININQIGCNSVVYKGVTYTSSTVRTDTTKSIGGCDSIYTIATITVNKITATTQNSTVTGTNSVVYNNVTYYASTVVTDTVKTAGGCDSIYHVVSIVVNTGSISISGNILTPLGKIIPLISAKLSGSSVQSNIVNGVYTFGLPYNSSGAVKLYKDNEVNKDNGVSGIDVVLEQSHILGKNILNSPYKLIAADINGDGKITALDIVYMKRVILGIDTTFTNSTTKQTRMWAFVNNGYVFPDITNPFPYNDSINFINQDSSVGNKSFTGMKLGDVNWDWDAAVARPNNNTLNAVELSYSLANTYPSDALPGRTDGYIHIPVRVKNFRDLLTMQFTINFDTTVLKWNGIDNNLMNFDLGTNHAEEGKITFLWNDPHNEVETLADGSVLFELVFQKIDNGQLIIDNENTNTISLDGSVTKVEAYDKDYGLHGVVLNRVENIQPLQVESWTVAPNPTTDGIIHVQMNLRDKKTIVFRLSDNTGKVVMVMQVEGVKGSNTINLRIGQQLTMGVYYLKAEGVEGVKELIIKN